MVAMNTNDVQILTKSKKPIVSEYYCVQLF